LAPVLTDQYNCCADPDRMPSGCEANETTSPVDYSLPASFPRSQCDSAMGSDHPSVSVRQLGEGSPSCREDSETGEGITDFAWSVLAVDVQDLSHIVPHDDVYAVDDPNDWFVSNDPRHIHWTSIDLQIVFRWMIERSTTFHGHKWMMVRKSIAQMTVCCFITTERTDQAFYAPFA
jgi:hypothetical protein